jgi:hypothetical protein
MSSDRKDLVPLAALLLLGSVAFVHLLALPAFEDEGSQLRWISRIIEAGEWRQPLNEGKPLEAWPMVPWVWLGLPALTVTRVTHVLAGMIGAVLTYQLAFALAGRWAAFASGVLFALCPFVVYLQRFALSDIFLCAGGIWVLVSVMRFIESRSWSQAAALGSGMALSAVCKLPVGFFFVIAVPVAMLILPARERSQMLCRPVLSKLAAAYLPVVGLALAVTLVALIRVQQGKSAGFGLTDLVGISMGRYSDIAASMGVAPVSLINELTTQLTWPVTIIGSAGLVAAVFLNGWRQRWLIAMGLLPLLGIGFFATFWYPRYLLFTLPPLIVGAVCGWSSLTHRLWRWRRAVRYAVFALCAGCMGHQSALIIFKPVAARWSPVDRFQYFEGWGSGYGYPEAAKFLVTAAHAPPDIFALDGHSAYQLRSYLPAQWGARIRPIFYGPDGKMLGSESARLANLLGSTPAWIVISPQLLQVYLDSSFGPGNLAQFSLRQIASFDKPAARSQLAIYEATPR